MLNKLIDILIAEGYGKYAICFILGFTFCHFLHLLNGDYKKSPKYCKNCQKQTCEPYKTFVSGDWWVCNKCGWQHRNPEK